MYGNANMQESELYFALLQLLRLFSLSIDETAHYLEGCFAASSFLIACSADKEIGPKPPPGFQFQGSPDYVSIDPSELKVIKKNWENVQDYFKVATNTIRTQIRQKEEVIHSLRSGGRKHITPPLVSGPSNSAKE